MKSAFVMTSKMLVMIAVCAVFFAFSTQEAQACQLKKTEDRYNKALAAYNANPSPGNAAKLCGAIDKLRRKFGVNKPKPPGLVCGGGGGGPAPPGPGGRGGGPGGGGPGGGGPGGGPGGGFGPPGGGPIGMNGWARNFQTTPCQIDYNILPVAGNPPGFTITGGSGTVIVGANSTTILPFSVTIASSVPAGTIAYFDIFFFDHCTGQNYTDEFSRFVVKATGGITVTNNTPNVTASPGVPVKLSWTLANTGATTQTVTLDYSYKGDPASVGSLNDGTLYDIKNHFSLNRTKRLKAGGTVTLAPGDTMLVEKAETVLGEFCDPEMISCCALVVDGEASCSMLFNDHNMNDGQLEPALTLSGTPSGGSVTVQVISVDGEVFHINAVTKRGMTIADVMDELARVALKMAETEKGFNFMPVVEPNTFNLLRVEGTLVTAYSEDGRLTWLQDADVIPIDDVVNPGRDGMRSNQ